MIALRSVVDVMVGSFLLAELVLLAQTARRIGFKSLLSGSFAKSYLAVLVIRSGKEWRRFLGLWVLLLLAVSLLCTLFR